MQRLGIPEELIHTVAEREQQELERRERLYRGDRPAYDGNVGQQAVIVDDVLDTGGTLVSCCEQLQQRGVRDITILVTHGLFTGTLWQQLWTFQVKRVSCTDTIPWGKERPDENIGTLSVLPLLSQYLQARS